MTKGDARGHWRSAAMLAPLILFSALFFLWPLASVMTVAVSDPVILRAFPGLGAASEDWSRNGPPTPAMQRALVDDIRSIDDAQVLGAAVRRLNAAHAGFRSLMGRTAAAVRSQDGTDVDLFAVDARWREPEPWRAIIDGLSPYTDEFLLAAIDYGRDENGAITRLPPDKSGNRYVFARTIWIALQVTAATIAIGLPYALLMASVTGWTRHALMAALLVPMWTSVLVRTAAWFIMLQDQGLINEVLVGTGLTRDPLTLLFNRAGVLISMTHQTLPYMVLPIFSVLVSLPKSLMPAAASLGAHPLRAFWRILLPLSLRGIVSGALLVFMTSIGFYIVPALVGGPRDQLISSLIAHYATGTANWQMASALGLVLLGMTGCLYAVYSRFAGSGQIGR